MLEAIRDLGLELQIIFNKGAVMVLPSTVNKATGLAAALKRLKITPDSVVGVGDAENDHAFIKACGCGVAVANAIPSLEERGRHRARQAARRGRRRAHRPDDRDRPCRHPLLAGRAPRAEEGFDEEHSFWFRGPDGALKLRAQSLPCSCRSATASTTRPGCTTCKAGDFERWFRDTIGDEALAGRARDVAADGALDAAATRRAIREAVGERGGPRRAAA